jgi:hypothetical protein
MYLSCLPYVTHAPPISLFMTCSPAKHMVTSTDRKAPCYGVFSTFHWKFTAKLKRIFLWNYFGTYPQTCETECHVKNYPALSQTLQSASSVTQTHYHIIQLHDPIIKILTRV